MARQDSGLKCEFESKKLKKIQENETTIKLHYSSINYKDALGVLGKGKIFRTLPIVPGIDAAGVIEESFDETLPVGQEVVITGCGFGETHDGGYAEYCQVPNSWIIPLPEGISMRDAMILGTAGFTAGLCLYKLELNGQNPAKGTLVVSGASGGVGSLAVNILTSRGYSVVAVSGKSHVRDYLESLGACEVIHPSEFTNVKSPLESVKFAGAIDNVGGDVLKGILATTDLWGNVASVGLALSPVLSSTVMPFILRGVSLLGVSSTNCPYELRKTIWKKLSTDYKPKNLDRIFQDEIPLSQIKNAFSKLIERQSVGRYIVNCQT